jgi:hypothetical protein
MCHLEHGQWWYEQAGYGRTSFLDGRLAQLPFLKVDCESETLVVRVSALHLTRLGLLVLPLPDLALLRRLRGEQALSAEDTHSLLDLLLADLRLARIDIEANVETTVEVRILNDREVSEPPPERQRRLVA